jgi:hypothetical protein
MSNTGNPVDRFNLGLSDPPKNDPNYNRPFGSELPALRAYGNVTYLQLIDIISNLWEKAHPELKIIPFGSREKFDPEIGYIVYHLNQKVPKANNTKPQFREDVAITDGGNIDLRIFTQSFMHLIEFTAIHYDPRTAEEILEAFEDFMMIITPEIKCVGAEEFIYNRRIADRDETRFGADVASRSVLYSAILQKMVMVQPESLEAIQIEVRILREMATPEVNEVFIIKIPSDAP